MTENPVPSRPRPESWYGIVKFVGVEGDAMLDGRVRRVANIPEPEETGRSGVERMVSIMFAYRERRFLRGLCPECERKNDLRGSGDEVFLTRPRHTRYLTFRSWILFQAHEDLPEPRIRGTCSGRKTSQPWEKLHRRQQAASRWIGSTRADDHIDHNPAQRFLQTSKGLMVLSPHHVQSALEREKVRDGSCGVVEIPTPRSQGFLIGRNGGGE